MDGLTLEPAWKSLESCPACLRPSRTIVGSLGIKHYVFGSSRVKLPRSGVALARCDGCGLVYKLVVPAAGFLKTITALEQSALWLPTYDFAAEIDAIDAHYPSLACDLLDVGAAGGEFLRAAAAGQGRRSALDIVRFDRLTVSGDGEFIRGFIDDPVLDWSGKPYDVVTAFDVFEHVYAPPRAMANLHALAKPGGIVIIETGNTDSVAARELDRWYYLAYFEHHVAWNARAITALAERFAFDVLSIETKRHKLFERAVFAPKAALKYHCFRLSPKIYHAIQYWGGYDGSTPIRPNAKDHMRIVLRRRP